MVFCIQASNPKAKTKRDESDENISDAIESIFSLYTEDAFLEWNHIHIALSYKYDIAYMISDIVYILKSLRTEDKGTIKMNWLPDTFRVDWTINWQNGNIEIDSAWYCVRGNVNALNENKLITMKICDFVNEWKQIFDVVINALTNNGYTPYNLDDMGLLLEEYAAIKGTGKLYQDA